MKSTNHYLRTISLFFLLCFISMSTFAQTISVQGTVKDAAGEPIIGASIVEPFHYLRPIPQGQIDGMTVDEATKKAYQNPGY